MASYSKQMMDVAKEWLAANPDPKSPFLKVPGFSKNGRRPGRWNEDFTRYEDAAKTRPEIAPLLDDLRRKVQERDVAAAALHAKEKEAEDLISQAPEPGHEKRDVDDHFHADLGRWCLAWARHGHNVFDLSADFTAAMLLTDARELDVAEVRLPFRGILMLVPDGFARGVEGSSYTKIHVTEIPRTDVLMLDAAAKVTAALDDVAPDDRRKMLDELISRPPPLITAKSPDPDDTAIHIYASDGSHVLDTVIDRKNLSWEAFDALPDAVEDLDDRRARHTLRQIVFGTLAYMSAVSGAAERVEVAGPSKKRPASNDPSPTRWTVGRTIKIGPELVRAVRGGAREVAFRLKSRHIVIGHYRNQPHGPGRVDRKRIWIMPFWKGPQEGAVLVHTYKPVKEDPSAS